MPRYYSGIYIEQDKTDDLIGKLKEYYCKGSQETKPSSFKPEVVDSLKNMLSQKQKQHKNDSQVMSALGIVAMAFNNAFNAEAPCILIGDKVITIFKEDFDIGDVKEEAQDLSSFLNCPVLYTYSCFDYVIYGIYHNGESTSGIKSNYEFSDDPYIDDFKELLHVNHKKFLELGRFSDVGGEVSQQMDSIQTQDEMEEFLNNLLNTNIRYHIDDITDVEGNFENVFNSEEISFYKTKK